MIDKKERERTSERERELSANYDLYIECFSLQIIITDSQLAAYAIAQICLHPREDP